MKSGMFSNKLHVFMYAFTWLTISAGVIAVTYGFWFVVTEYVKEALS